MDIAIEAQGAAILFQHRIGEPAPDQAVDPHLGHLGPAGESELEADRAFTVGVAAGHGGALDVIGLRQVEWRVLAELGQRAGSARGLVEGVGDGF